MYLPLVALRFIFVLVAAGLAVSLIQSGVLPEEDTRAPWIVFLGMLCTAIVIIGVDIWVRKKSLAIISSIYFGMIVGLFLAYVVRQALVPLPLWPWWRSALDLVIPMVLCYSCISLLMQTRNDFRFILPYVEFSREVKGGRPFVLDTSVVIDGRIADMMETHIIDNPLIMPRFVLAELQTIADSSDRLRRSRGRRGLDVLNRLRNNAQIDLKINEEEQPEWAGEPVDLKLVLLTKKLEGKVVTNDFNLNKVAQVHGVDVINLNDVANTLKPVFLPGETLDIQIIRPGEEMGQGVGYLDDGTMVVVEGGREHVQKFVRVNVTSVRQTSAGRMIFGRFETIL